MPFGIFFSNLCFVQMIGTIIHKERLQSSMFPIYRMGNIPIVTSGIPVPSSMMELMDFLASVARSLGSILCGKTVDVVSYPLCFL